MILALLVLTGTSEAFEVSLSPHYNGGDGTYTEATRDSEAVWIPSSYLYFSAPGFPASVQSAYLEITYYDEPIGSTMRVQYDSDSDAYTMSDYHTRSSGEGTDTFVKSYHRLDNPGFTDRQNGGSDFRINGGGFPIKSMIIRDTPFGDPYAAYALSHNPPWLSPYSGPSRDDVNADTLKGKVMTGYQGWFKTPNDLYDAGWVHWGFDGNGNSTVDMWPNPDHYDPASLHPVPNVFTESEEQGYVFSSADPEAVNKHFEWMRKYNIDGAYLQRFVSRSRSGYYGYPEWVLNNVRQAANLHGRIWAIEYDISSLSSEADPFEVITNDWNFLVNDCHILDDPRYAHEDGKPVLFIWGFSVPDREVTLENADAILDWFNTQDLYLIGGVHSSWESMTDWYDHYQKYDQILAWMERTQSDLVSQKNKLDSWGMKILPHAWPGFSWHNLKEYVFPRSYTDRAGGDFYWDKIYNAVSIGADQIFLGMFDEYDEGTAIMPMSDDPPVVPYPNIPNIDGDDDWGYYITNDGMPDDWWMTLSGHAKEMLCDQISLTSSLPSEASL
ncbi:MAG: hypothetical protein KAR47_12005, partial [Planctomycetes bacterium]|nr:hypothetical protein [Planctomycetota bacterium]